MTRHLQRVDARPQGAVLAESEGRVAGRPFTLTLTQHQLHFQLEDGPAYAIDLNRLATAALGAIAADLERGEP